MAIGGKRLNKVPSKFVTLNKSDFLVELSTRGLALESKRLNRGEWNERVEYYISGNPECIGSVFKGDRADWNEIAVNSGIFD